ncbi:arylsulfatase [Thalassoglobus polymorphus]|uniref:Arylsulfatase n=1 Tax=Thalassoglobus polymorphus TaxID=2527994 RepID=A0A517QUW7_9PLAN|nr:arylsulfatase [Thalassoglobus polymorphus]QDT35413.1 Arylsulfatase [Thalassoglobus polymorphus]
MIHRFAALCICVVLTFVSSSAIAKPPNFLVIMVDDLGYSDLGCYGSEIDTPNLDSLAMNGLRFTQFYNTARCWPSRAALLTGYYAQQVRRDAFPGLPEGKRGDRPEWARLLPEVLSQAGYRSYHSGKWHLDGKPIETGFHRSYLLRDQGRFFNPHVHWLDDERLPAIKKGTSYYGTTVIADHAVRCLQEHAGSQSEKPFFHYLAFTAPHFPLHALPQDIAKYKDRYHQGWDKVREERWQRIKEMGLVSADLSAVEEEIGPPYHFPDHLKILGDGEVNRPVPWDSLTPEQKKFQADKMALHAAMIDRVDQEIGRVLKQLKKMKAFEETLILFLSDNGASAEIMVRSDGHDPAATPGSADSYLCLGPGWSTVCNTPFRRHKTWTHEGGCATPFIAHWPNVIKDKGSLRKTPAHIIDIAPTLIELAKTERFKEWKGKPVPVPPGKSLTSLFQQDAAAHDRTLWWSHEANHAIRKGDWKAVVSGDDAEWELYNLETDRTETSNIASANPDKLDELKQEWTSLRDKFYRIATGK